MIRNTFRLGLVMLGMQALSPGSAFSQNLLLDVIHGGVDDAEVILLEVGDDEVRPVPYWCELDSRSREGLKVPTVSRYCGSTVAGTPMIPSESSSRM